MICTLKRRVWPGRRLGETGVALLGACCLALAAGAQTIKIPDFRQTYKPVVLAPGEACVGCGRIASIREIRADRERRPSAPVGLPPATGTPTIADRPLVGAVVYLPLDAGTTERPFVGGVGTPEMRERFHETTYEIAVRLDDGSMRFMQRNDGSRYQVGDRVRMTGATGFELVIQ